MRLWAMACVARTVGALSGCHKKAADMAASDLPAAADDPGFLGLGSKHGRYAAIGIYSPGQSWSKLVVQSHPSDPLAARLGDDQAIIVVSDSQTGAVRACGDLSGYCIGMNPWKAQLVDGEAGPIQLSEHVKPYVAEPIVITRTVRKAPAKPIMILSHKDLKVTVGGREA